MQRFEQEVSALQEQLSQVRVSAQALACRNLLVQYTHRPRAAGAGREKETCKSNDSAGEGMHDAGRTLRSAPHKIGEAHFFALTGVELQRGAYQSS